MLAEKHVDNSARLTVTSGHRLALGGGAARHPVAVTATFQSDLRHGADQEFVDLVVQHGRYLDELAAISRGGRLALCAQQQQLRN